MNRENTAGNSILQRNSELVGRIFRDTPFVCQLGITLGLFGLGWCEKNVHFSTSLRQQHRFTHARVLMTALCYDLGIERSMPAWTLSGGGVSAVPGNRFACRGSLYTNSTAVRCWLNQELASDVSSLRFSSPNFPESASISFLRRSLAGSPP